MAKSEKRKAPARRRKAQQRRGQTSARRGMPRWLRLLALLFAAVSFFTGFLADGFVVRLDRVVVAKYMYGLFLPFTNEAVVNWGVPNVGDVVIVRSPTVNQTQAQRLLGDALGVRPVALHPQVQGLDAPQGEEAIPGTEDRAHRQL